MPSSVELHPTKMELEAAKLTLMVIVLAIQHTRLSRCGNQVHANVPVSESGRLQRAINNQGGYQQPELEAALPEGRRQQWLSELPSTRGVVG